MSSTEEIDYKQLLSFIMHDLRSINAMIRDSSRLLSVALRGTSIDEPSVRHHAAIIVEQAATLSSWLAIADMYIEPDRFAKEPLTRVSLHEIFYKAFKNFKRLASMKSILLSLDGTGKFYLDAHPVIEIMPYVLLDNAVKYSPNSSKISVTLEEDSANLYVLAESIGPRVDEDELASLGIVGFRGKHAARRTQLGTGQGLALLKTICDYHRAEMIVSSGPTISDIDGVPFGWFTVKIQFPRGASN